MKIARPVGGLAALCALAVSAVLYCGTPVRGFDIQDSAAIVARPGVDISDTYFFPSPTNPNDVVIVMNLSPGLPAGTGNTAFFDSSALYTLKFDTNYASEAVGSRPTENLVMQFSMSLPASGTQQVFVYGPSVPNSTGSTTSLVNAGTTNGTGLINKSFTTSSAIAVFAGVREDPFFFDLTQFYSIVPDRHLGSSNATCLPGGSGTCPQGFNTAGAASDFFSNSNVLSIVVEMPKSFLTMNGNSLVAYWATSSTQSGN